jgi:hypothetical protein
MRPQNGREVVTIVIVVGAMRCTFAFLDGGNYTISVVFVVVDFCAVYFEIPEGMCSHSFKIVVFIGCWSEGWRVIDGVKCHTLIVFITVLLFDD